MPLVLNNPFFYDCQKLNEDRKGTPMRLDGTRDYIQKYRVVVKDQALNSVSVCLCPGLPLGGSLYLEGDDFDIYALLVEMSAEQEVKDDWQNWIVTCRYSTELPTKGGPPPNVGNANQKQGSQNNPDQELPDVNWDFEAAQIADPTDLDGQLFLNTARDPYSPAPTYESGYPILNITRNEIHFNNDKAQAYSYSVNKEDFFGRPPGSVLCLPPKAQQVWKGKYRYWKVSYRLKFPRAKYFPDPAHPGKYLIEYKTQQLQLVSNGIRQWWTAEELRALGFPAGTKAQARPITIGMHVVHHPVLLDCNGKRQEPDAEGNMGRCYNIFRIYNSWSFRDLIIKGLA